MIKCALRKAMLDDGVLIPWKLISAISQNCSKKNICEIWTTSGDVYLTGMEYTIKRCLAEYYLQADFEDSRGPVNHSTIPVC